MSKILNSLPNITLSEVSTDVETMLEKIVFKSIDEAPWWLRFFSNTYNEFYLSYKDTVYVPNGHLAIATAKEPNQRLIATSKILPWVYAIKNGSVSSPHKFLQTVFNVEVRSYYFLFEFAFLKAHELEDLPELIAAGFLSSRKNILGIKKDPDNVIHVLKSLLATKINREA